MKSYCSDMKPDLSLIMKRVGQGVSKTGIILSLALCLCLLTELHAQTILKKASFAPQWLPQAQFAGYMVALDKGFLP